MSFFTGSSSSSCAARRKVLFRLMTGFYIKCYFFAWGGANPIPDPTPENIIYITFDLFS